MIAIDTEKCTGCGICPGVCPRPVLGLSDGKAEVREYTNCLECAACSLNCPENAIRVTKGTGCIAAIIREDILKTAPKGTGCGCGDGGTEAGGCC